MITQIYIEFGFIREDYMNEETLIRAFPFLLFIGCAIYLVYYYFVIYKNDEATMNEYEELGLFHYGACKKTTKLRKRIKYNKRYNNRKCKRRN
jgi:hypothetical protein